MMISGQGVQAQPVCAVAGAHSPVVTINLVYQGQLSGTVMTTTIGGFTQRFQKQ